MEKILDSKIARQKTLEVLEKSYKIKNIIHEINEKIKEAINEGEFSIYFEVEYKYYKYIETIAKIYSNYGYRAEYTNINNGVRISW